MREQQINESFFPIKEVPAIQYPDSSDELNQEEYQNTGYKFIVREDTNQVLSCMSEDYKVITNKQIMDIALPVLGKKKAELVECRMFADGARVQWKYRIPDVRVEVSKGDFINPEIIIKNSYDGSTEVKAFGGAYRLICSNGMVIGYAIGENRGIRHIGNNTHNDVERIINSIIMQVTEIFNKDFPKLIETNIRKSHIGEIIKLFPETVMKDVVNKLITSNPKTYWDLLNAATFIATHKMKRQNEATHKLENKIFPTIKKLVGRVAQA